MYINLLQKLFACCHELQVNKADRTEVDVVTYCDELQVNKVDRTEVNVVTHCDELQVNKVHRTEVLKSKCEINLNLYLSFT
jgi:hypothetical protein